MTDEKSLNTQEIALELDVDLRLHPQQLNLGKAELLTDALTLPFTDIESRLGHFALSASEQEKQQLRKSMKSFLGRLNANPHIPLKFRLKALNRFEQELDLFDAEMTAAVLNAHKVGVQLVQEAARNEQSYYPMLVDMIANAIELAVKLLLIELEQYRAPAIIVTRQFFDLAKLGLEVAAIVKKDAPAKTARLHKAISNHEMLRALDFFGKSGARQQKTWQELQYHIGSLKPSFCKSGNSCGFADNRSYMYINLNRPNEAGKIVSSIPDPADYDCIIIPLHDFITRLSKGIQSVASVLHDQHAQKKALHTEDALDNTIVGGRAILNALKGEKRTHDRASRSETRIQLSWELSQAIIRAYRPPDTFSDSQVLFDQSKAWNLVDLSSHGMCLERMHTQPLNELLGSMVGLQWLIGEERLCMKFIPWKEGMDESSAEPPALGFIRWARQNKAGEQRIGIEFVAGHYKPAKAVMLSSNREIEEKRSWPILVQPGKETHTVLFPDPKVYRGMTFMILQGRQSAHFKIGQISHAGSNYCICEILHADTGRRQVSPGK